MGSIGSIKDILSIKIKHRHDSYTDQFCRIFMSKMFIISALVMGVDFFNDKVSCIVPKESNLGMYSHSYKSRSSLLQMIYHTSCY